MKKFWGQMLVKETKFLRKYWVTFDQNKNWNEMIEAESFAEACQIAHHRMQTYNDDGFAVASDVSIIKLEEE